jgi:transcriptional regulator with XRE-family HTH domain
MKKKRRNPWEPSQDFVNFRNAFVDKAFQKAARQGISLIEIARQSDLAPTTIYNLDSRKTRVPSSNTIYKIAHALGYSINFVDSDKPYRSKRKKIVATVS